MKEILKITKALADENRIRILIALDKGELCVCQVTELLKLAPSTVSKHISILKNADLVDANKKGRWVIYSLSKNLKNNSKEILSWVKSKTKDSLKIIKDKDNLEKIKKIDLELICKKKKN